MANAEQLEIIKQGPEVWNKWREEHPEAFVNLFRANLSGANLEYADLRGANLIEASLLQAFLGGANLTGAELNGADLNDAILFSANLTGVNLTGANLSDASLIFANLASANLTGATFSNGDLNSSNLTGANCRDARFLNVSFEEAMLVGAKFVGASFEGANCTKADLREADLRRANFKRANLTETNFTGANLSGANLRSAIFIKTNLENATITGCKIFGLSAWALEGSPKEQSNLIITDDEKPTITVDNLQVAQFIHLLLDNKRVRNVIDTITSKAVLILGRFTAERKAVLDALHTELQERNYLPILFDFDGPTNRDITETVSTLAHMARFVIADITDAKSIPQELQAIVPNLPSVPVKPILLASQSEYGMFEHFKRYPWVLPTYYYQDIQEAISLLPEQVLNPLEAKVKELTGKG